MSNSTSFSSSLHKLITIGDSSVGKTSLINRYCCEQFSFNLTSTIGLDFKYKDITVEKQKVRMQVWDTAGQERYQNMTKSFFKKVSGVLLVFSLTSRQSFKNVEKWLKLLQNEVGDTIPKVLVGNKFDLFEQREVSRSEAQALAAKHNMAFYEVSAKLSYNLNQTFESLVKQIIKNEDPVDLETEKRAECRLSSFKHHVKGCEC